MILLTLIIYLIGCITGYMVLKKFTLFYVPGEWDKDDKIGCGMMSLFSWLTTIICAVMYLGILLLKSSENEEELKQLENFKTSLMKKLC